jgi:hypothetical protein
LSFESTRGLYRTGRSFIGERAMSEEKMRLYEVEITVRTVVVAESERDAERCSAAPATTS